MRRRIKEDFQEKWFYGLMVLLLLGVCVGGYFLISYGNEQDRESKRIDKETAFSVEGTVTAMKTVIKPHETRFLGTFGTDETLYVQVGDQEYQITQYLLQQIRKGDHVKVSGKRGMIEGLEVVR